MRFESVRMMIAVAASGELHIKQMHVTTTFLYATQQEVVYLEIPEGMFTTEMPGRRFRLLKALYGLQQSPHMFLDGVSFLLDKNQALTRILAVKTDPCATFSNPPPKY